MIISWESLRSRAFGDIDSEKKRTAILEWLRDRKEFHTWFASLNTASFALFSLFGSEAGFQDVGEVFITIALVLFLFSILGNLVILWSIPSWKIMITLEEIRNCSRMRWDFRLTTWFAVVCFLGGLVMGFIGNIPA